MSQFTAKKAHWTFDPYIFPQDDCAIPPWREK